ncbi:class I SAM-dependent methyltransferase [Candidatus Omnitrophota bacterium]
MSVELNSIKRTKDSYSFLWREGHRNSAAPRWHFNDMQEAIKEPIVRGRIGMDLGSGCGYDTYIMAENNPQVKIVSLDISDGVFMTRGLTRRLENVLVLKGSALDLPLKSYALDFVYSFGVLHHLVDPTQGLKEVHRVLKSGSRAFIYLYEDHSDNRIKSFALKMVGIIRKASVKLPPRLLFIISLLISPFVVLLFSWPARALSCFKPSSKLARAMPFNFGTHPFSVAGDLFDRFSTPVEHRFSREGVAKLFQQAGFCNTRIEKLSSSAGWIARGEKSDA